MRGWRWRWRCNNFDFFRELPDDRLDLVLVFALIRSQVLEDQDRPPVGIRIEEVLSTLRNETLRAGLPQPLLVLSSSVTFILPLVGLPIWAICAPR